MLFIQNIDFGIDSLVVGIQKALEHINVNYPSWLISGSIGVGARFSLAMNVKSGREIGHPSSNYIWDIISTSENCFHELGIDWQLFINQAYDNRARATAASQQNSISDHIRFIETLEQLQGDIPIIYADPSGEWIYSESKPSNSELKQELMPFGVVAFQIKNIIQNHNLYHFPTSTLSYLIRTLERGEEPMEIEGHGHYSVVSGWKAFARWMQAYSIPIKGIKHNYLNNVIRLLAVRRNENARYWYELSNRLDKKIESDFAFQLYSVYSKISDKITNTISADIIKYPDIKEIYYTEQESLPVYKQIKSYLKI
ncbi:MAG: hypothetical protein GPJ54_00680 [Candidatus Heimdallarchaeota archaeon]|nr:hypothetical protein [Candidatus Heimdallarchaeota archaeon]